MSDQISSLLHAIEIINADFRSIKNSREFRIGRRFLQVQELLRGNLSILAGMLYKLRYLTDPGTEQPPWHNRRSDNGLTSDTRISFKSHNGQEKHIAVYTCVTDAYDAPVSPLFCTKHEDYYFFSDEKTQLPSAPWRRVDISELAQIPGINANRYIKLHPFVLFQDCDYAIYIDGQVQVVSEVATWCEIASSSPVGIAMHSHHARSCVYREAFMCCLGNKGKKREISAYIRRLELEGMPHDFGLAEATVIVVDLRNDCARVILEEWWNELVETKVGRDQLIFPYVLWKRGLSFAVVGKLGDNVWESEKLRFPYGSRHGNSAP